MSQGSEKMVIKRKTQIILALIVSSVFFFQGCASIFPGTSKRTIPERRQGDLIITKKDGHKIEGELITVKENSLLLLDTEGKDVSVGIADIKVIKIVKKSSSLLGVVIGGAIGGGIGLYGMASAYNASVARGEDGGLIPCILLGSIVVPAALAIGGAFGGGIGALVGKDETIYFTGMTDSEIQKTLDKLRKKARIRDYK